MGKVLGKGSFCTVVGATHKTTGNEVAIKIYRKSISNPRNLVLQRRDSIMQRISAQ